MIIKGHTGYHVQRNVTQPFHSVQCGLEFDSSQLSAVKAVDWISKRGTGTSPSQNGSASYL